MAWQASPKAYPKIDRLESGRATVEPGDKVVFLDMTVLGKPQEVRDWLGQNVASAFAFHGRFKYEEFNYRIDIELLGANFEFEDEFEAMMFKLRWF